MKHFTEFFTKLRIQAFNSMATIEHHKLEISDIRKYFLLTCNSNRPIVLHLVITWKRQDCDLRSIKTPRYELTGTLCKTRFVFMSSKN